MIAKDTLLIIRALKRGLKMIVALLEKIEKGEPID
jgi:hypothetical protein